MSSRQPSSQPGSLGFRLPPSVKYQNMNWATVTETGTRITVPKSTVTLTIPQGAVNSGRTQDIYVAVITDKKPRLLNSDSETNNLITPVVQWGFCSPSQRWKLNKPVVLSIPHSKYPKLSSNIQIHHCPDIDLDNSEWQNLNSNADQNNIQIDPSHCHVVTDKLGSFVMISPSQQPGYSNGQLSGFQQNGQPGFQPGTAGSCMSVSTKQALCRCLDVPTCQGNDWRKLAEVIGVNHYSAHFANQASPSEAILNLWESQNNIKDNHTALLELAQLLKDINRLDALVILERELK